MDENDELDTNAIYSMLFLIGDTNSDVNNESGFFWFFNFYWVFFEYSYFATVTDNYGHLLMIEVFCYKMFLEISYVYLPSREQARVELLLWLEVFKLVWARLFDIPGIIRYD